MRSPSFSTPPPARPKTCRALGSASKGPATTARSSANVRLISVPNRAKSSAGRIRSSILKRPALRCMPKSPRAMAGSAAGRSVPEGISVRAPAGKTMARARPRCASNTTQAPPPPSPAREGSVTVKAKAPATAASTAEPPLERISRATIAARGSSAATPPRKPATWPGVPKGIFDRPVTASTVRSTVDSTVWQAAKARPSPMPNQARPSFILPLCCIIRLFFLTGRASRRVGDRD